MIFAKVSQYVQSSMYFSPSPKKLSKIFDQISNTKIVFILPHIGTLEKRSWGEIRTLIAIF